MLRLSSIFLFLLFTSMAFPQVTDHIESLQLEYLKEHPDSTKVRIMNALATAYLQVNPDSSISLALKAQELARGIGKENWNSKLLIAQAKNIKRDYNQALEILNELANDRKKYALIAEDLRDIYYEKGRAHRDLGNNDSSLAQYQKALAISTQMRDTLDMESDLYLLSNVYLDFGQYGRALRGFQQCIRYAESLKDNYEITGPLFNDVARVYVFTKDFNKAEEYFLKAYEISLKNDLINTLQVSTNNLGFIKKEKGEYTEALTYFYEALTFRANDSCRVSYPLFNIGNIHRRTGNYDSANYYLTEAFEENIPCHDTYIETLIKMDMGELAIEQNKLDKAEGHFTEALSISQKSHLIGEERDVYLALSKVYDLKGSYKKAYSHFRKYEQIKDSLFNESKARELERLENNYSFEQEREAAETNQKLSDLRKQKEIDDAVKIRNYFILAFAIMLLVTIFSYTNLKRKKNANLVLYKLNSEIKQQKEELVSQAENLKKVNEEITQINENLEQRVVERTKVIAEQKEKMVDFMMYNSHEVRSPLARILGLISLFETDALSAKEAVPSLKEIKESAKELDKMIKKMSLRIEQEKNIQS